MLLLSNGEDVCRGDDTRIDAKMPTFRFNFMLMISMKWALVTVIVTMLFNGK